MMALMMRQPITANSNENAVVQRDVVRGDVQFDGTNLDAIFDLMTPTPVIISQMEACGVRADIEVG